MNTPTSIIKPLFLAASLLAASALPVHAAGQVEVSYVKPEEFRDAGRGVVDRERTLGTLTQYLQQLAKKLPEGQMLRLEVTDIDLAGEIYPGRHLNDVRVLRGGADWPHINLRYTLLDGSRMLKAGEAKLADSAYMFTRHSLPIQDSELAYEKRMLKQWFDQNFIAAQR